MPKPSVRARMERRAAERRLATGYGWPAKRSRRRDIELAVGIVILIATGVVLVLSGTVRL